VSKRYDCDDDGLMKHLGTDAGGLQLHDGALPLLLRMENSL